MWKLFEGQQAIACWGKFTEWIADNTAVQDISPKVSGMLWWLGKLLLKTIENFWFYSMVGPIWRGEALLMQILFVMGLSFWQSFVVMICIVISVSSKFDYHCSLLAL